MLLHKIYKLSSLSICTTYIQAFITLYFNCRKPLSSDSDKYNIALSKISQKHQFFSEFSHQAYYPSFCIPSLIPCFCSSKIYIFFFLNKSATDMQGIQVDIKLHREFSYLRCFKHNILKSANQQLQLNLSNNTVETISRDHWHWYCASFLTWNGSKY